MKEIALEDGATFSSLLIDQLQVAVYKRDGK